MASNTLGRRECAGVKVEIVNWVRRVWIGLFVCSLALVPMDSSFAQSTTTTLVTSTTGPESSATTTTLGVTTTVTTVRHATTTTLDPGSLPQTSVEPPLATSPGSELFRLMSGLWTDIVNNDPRRADAMMFPELAYEKLKDIAYPADDYVNRLVYLFNLDVGAYHDFLLSKGTPVLLRVVTSPRDAQWIPVNACFNKIGYWHLPGVRFVFRWGSSVASVGVLSMISWRGAWYFIHLGQYTATGTKGQIYDFEYGPGEPGPPGSC